MLNRLGATLVPGQPLCGSRIIGVPLSYVNVYGESVRSGACSTEAGIRPPAATTKQVFVVSLGFPRWKLYTFAYVSLFLTQTIENKFP
jgi:hypothetical protein